MKKRFALAVIVTAAMALSLVGCGVKVTNISVPDASTLEKGESITLPVNFGTEDALQKRLSSQPVSLLRQKLLRRMKRLPRRLRS